MSEHPQDYLFNELKTRYESLRDEGDKGYQRLDEAADARIVRWRYAEQSAFELRADFFRRFNTKPGELVDEEPISAMHYYAYGYDAQERIVYAAQFHFEESPFISTFYEHDEGFIESAEYRREHWQETYRLYEISRLVTQPPDASPSYHAHYSDVGIRTAFSMESYHYDAAGRLSRISSSHRYDPQPKSAEAQQLWQHGIDQQRQIGKMFGMEESAEQFIGHLQNTITLPPNGSAQEEIYEYEAENLKRIVSHQTVAMSENETRTYHNTHYEARNPDETDEVLFEAARVSLRNVVIDHVNKFDDEDGHQTQVYCLSIAYDAVADDGLMLAIGTEDQRKAWDEETDEYTHRLLLYYNLNRIVELWDLPRDYQRFMKEFRREQRWDEIRDLHIRVARDLNDHDWTGTLNTTDDFIMFANDYESHTDIAIDIRACIPEAKLRILEEKGLLS